MAAVGAGYDWPRGSPIHRSPDTHSNVYPDRPIRPLPKGRLRSKLSPEQAASIIYPPVPPTTGKLFNFPYDRIGKESQAGGRDNRYDRDRSCDCGGDHSEAPSDEEDDERAIDQLDSPSLASYRTIPGRYPNGTGGNSGSTMKPPGPPGSTSSSVDGYESFENTNNKKKRKIPLSGSAGAHHTNLSAEMASMGISSNNDDVSTHGDVDSGVGQYYGSGSSAIPNTSSGTGISGAGRGRYGRSLGRSNSDRRPLGASTNGVNAFASSAKSRRDPNGTLQGPQAPSQGIISKAISQAAEQVRGEPPNGNENVSLLQNRASMSIPSDTQFTFGSESEAANKIVWPGQSGSSTGGRPYDPRADQAWPPPPNTAMPSSAAHRAPLGPNQGRRSVTQGTQTSPQMNGGQQGGAANAQQGQPPTQNGQQPAPKQKPKRNPEKLYKIAARQRKLQQEYQNYHHPPSSREDIWICEFCEYESIFGTPPRALIRQYEIKDRKERKRQAEKKRLLEKARMKGRKGKKGSKNAAKNAGNNSQPQNNTLAQNYDQPLDNVPLPDQDDEYYDGEYDDTMPPHPDDVDSHVNGNYADKHPVLGSPPGGYEKGGMQPEGNLGRTAPAGGKAEDHDGDRGPGKRA